MKKKKVNKYWWDFEGPDTIIVESDDTSKSPVASFKYNPRKGFGCAKEAIKKAEECILALNNKQEHGAPFYNVTKDNGLPFSHINTETTFLYTTGRWPKK